MTRDDLMQAATELLRREPHVTNVGLFGSLGRGEADAYSDIDVRVELAGISDRVFAHRLSEIVKPLGTLLIDGWALHALPERYGRTFYFAEYPLFWHLDVACESPLHEDGSDLLQRYYPEQIFKIWLEVLSDLFRGEDLTAYLEGFMSRWADLTVWQNETPQTKLGYYLELCVARARSRGALIESLIARCDELRRAYLLDRYLLS